MNRNYNSALAKDVLSSIADKLPTNLMVDTVNEQGKFSITFLSRLTKEQMDILNKECEKKKNKDVFLEFSTIKEGSKVCASELKDFCSFNWNDVSSFTISGNTCPHLHSIHSAPYHYISVTFVMKS